MTRFEELQQAQLNASKNWYEFRERCWGYFFKLINGFAAHCGIPSRECLLYLKRDKDELWYHRPLDGGIYTLPGAAEFDQETGFWHLGLQVILSKDGSFPQQWISFVLCVSEINGSPVVKIGMEGPTKSLDLNNPQACADFYDQIIDRAIEILGEQRKPIKRSIGFEASPQSTSTQK